MFAQRLTALIKKALNGKSKWGGKTAQLNYTNRMVTLENMNDIGRRFAMEEMLNNLCEKPICKERQK